MSLSVSLIVAVALFAGANAGPPPPTTTTTTPLPNNPPPTITPLPNNPPTTTPLPNNPPPTTTSLPNNPQTTTTPLPNNPQTTTTPLPNNPPPTTTTTPLPNNPQTTTTPPPNNPQTTTTPLPNNPPATTTTPLPNNPPPTTTPPLSTTPPPTTTPLPDTTSTNIRVADTSPGAVSPASQSLVSVQWPPSASAVYRSTETVSVCLCRALCQADPRCEAGKAEQLSSGMFSCSLADKRSSAGETSQEPPQQGDWFERVIPDTGAFDCAALQESGVRVSGIYRIEASERPVYCDMETDGGGWTMLQRRGGVQPSTSFARTMLEYQDGFGHPAGEHWMGLEAFHRMENEQYVLQLRVDVWEAPLGFRRHAVYDVLYLDGARDDFWMHVYMTSGTAIDGFEMTSGDFFEACKEEEPCTFGGWWGFDKGKTGELSNLNGSEDQENPGMWKSYWLDYRGKGKAISRSTMMVRPVPTTSGAQDGH